MGLSNYMLDPAKMNRAVRADPFFFFLPSSFFEFFLSVVAPHLAFSLLLVPHEQIFLTHSFPGVEVLSNLARDILLMHTKRSSLPEALEQLCTSLGQFVFDLRSSRLASLRKDFSGEVCTVFPSHVFSLPPSLEDIRSHFTLWFLVALPCHS